VIGSSGSRISNQIDPDLGSSLDLSRPVRFSFDGKDFSGYAGDTLASALLANGVRTMSRSFKFHRPRGVFTCGIEEPNAFVQIRRGARSTPSARATLTDLVEGLETYSNRGWPSLRMDIGRWLDFTAPIWAAGFYNKTFISPSWHTYEWFIRRLAGFGHPPSEPDPDRYETRNLHCDVLVVGGGVQGLGAACAARNTDGHVVLVDQASELGGRCAWDGSMVDGIPGSVWAKLAADRLARAPDVRVLLRTAAVAYYDRDVIVLLETIPAAQAGGCRERYWIVRARRVVIATGAIEQPMIFCNNDRPGILLAGAAHEYLRRYAVAVGRRVVVATNNDASYGLVSDLVRAGVRVVAVADSRHQISQVLADGLRSKSIPLLMNSIPVDTRGRLSLTAVDIGRLSADDTRIELIQRISCDALAVSGGWSPTLHLFAQAGGRLTYREHSRSLQPVGSHPVIEIAGSGGSEHKTNTDSALPIGSRISPFGNTGRQWVDLRHDVTVSDLELSLRENYTSIEHLKRYTTLGMASDQGKTSNVAAIEIIARLRGMEPSGLGNTTARPPFVPVTLGAVAGRAVGPLFSPSRRLPMHDWHASHGAHFTDSGEWRRPVAYLRPGESRLCSALREAQIVRTTAGIFDTSPLGKIELQGPDVLEFLDHFYINSLQTLKIRRVRYGLMLRESGVVFDDGTVTMLAPDHLVITTTSGNAGHVSAWLEEWHQCEWPRLRVAITPVTEQWATISLTGPRARDILEELDTDIDLSARSFPHLEMREARILDCSARVFRVSFTGELSYEINVPPVRGAALWEALMDAGEPLGLQPFGLDAMLQLRLEKGFLHVGTDTDGSTVPNDVGWGKVAAGKLTDFVGRRSLLLAENLREDRMQLVGLTGEDDIVVGSHLRIANSKECTDGWVTSAGRTCMTGEWIALALVRGGRQLFGSVVTVHDAGKVTRAQVVKFPFYDPTGSRMHA
jgi:sarcosine oxidase, subunit alpha